MNNVKFYIDSNTEQLEKKLTLLALNNKNFKWDTQLIELMAGYRKGAIETINEPNADDIYYIDLLVNSWFKECFTRIVELESYRDTIHSNMIQLKQLQLPEQRSEEWYSIRENLLTASSLADALGKGHFKTRDDLLISKTSDTKDTISKTARDIMQWGVAYEEVATMFYEYLNGLKVIEFGLIPHPKLSVFGASPDGICDIGFRMDMKVGCWR